MSGNGRARLPVVRDGGEDDRGAPADPRVARRGLDRRSVLGRMAGMAVLGASGGGAILTRGLPAAGAATMIESGAIAPAVVQLIDAPTIAVDASLGNDFRLTLGGDRTMGGPTSGSDGQQIILQITQGAGGPFTVTWSPEYEFSTGLAEPVLSTGAGQTDLVGLMYSAIAAKWLLVAYLGGFS